MRELRISYVPIFPMCAARWELSGFRHESDIGPLISLRDSCVHFHGGVMKASCLRCKSPLRIPDESLQATIRFPGCRQPLRMPAATQSRLAIPRDPSLPSSRMKGNSEVTATFPRVAEDAAETGAASEPERTTFAVVILGVLIGICGFGWFGLVHLLPWAGCDSPLGSMIQSLHGVAAIGVAAIGFALTHRMRMLGSTACLFLVLAAAICMTGLVLYPRRIRSRSSRWPSSTQSSRCSSAAAVLPVCF
jgi:hypothetical protein